MAIALVHKPQLLFLDEPTAGLDPVASATLRDDLSRLVAQEGVTIFLTTHNLAEAEKLCTQVGVISHGQLLATGSPSDLRSRTSAPRLYVTGQGIDPQIVDVLKNNSLVNKVQKQNGKLITPAQAQRWSYATRKHSASTGTYAPVKTV